MQERWLLSCVLPGGTPPRGTFTPSQDQTNPREPVHLGVCTWSHSLQPERSSHTQLISPITENAVEAGHGRTGQRTEQEEHSMSSDASMTVIPNKYSWILTVERPSIQRRHGHTSCSNSTLTHDLQASCPHSPAALEAIGPRCLGLGSRPAKIPNCCPCFHLRATPESTLCSPDRSLGCPASFPDSRPRPGHTCIFLLSARSGTTPLPAWEPLPNTDDGGQLLRSLGGLHLSLTISVPLS